MCTGTAAPPPSVDSESNDLGKPFEIGGVRKVLEKADGLLVFEPSHVAIGAIDASLLEPFRVSHPHDGSECLAR